MRLQLIYENHSKVLCSIIFHLDPPLTHAKSLFVFLFVSFGKFGRFTQGLLANLLLFICLFLYSLCLALLSRRGAGAGKMVGEQRTNQTNPADGPAQLAGLFLQYPWCDPFVVTLVALNSLGFVNLESLE